jgi:hypothetical protein
MGEITQDHYCKQARKKKENSLLKQGLITGIPADSVG